MQLSTVQLSSAHLAAAKLNPRGRQLAIQAQQNQRRAADNHACIIVALANQVWVQHQQLAISPGPAGHPPAGCQEPSRPPGVHHLGLRARSSRVGWALCVQVSAGNPFFHLFNLLLLVTRHAQVANGTRGG